jgi:hypothetical protein
MLSEAVVWMAAAVKPARPKLPDSAMLKQAASAAAINSSGFAPGASSKRAENVIGVFCKARLVVEAVPAPLFKSPCHVALAVRTMSAMMIRFSLVKCAT